MKKMLEIRKEIEMARRELDVVVSTGVSTEECYKVSLRLDHLIEDYMQCTQDKFHMVQYR